MCRVECNPVRNLLSLGRDHTLSLVLIPFLCLFLGINEEITMALKRKKPGLSGGLLFLLQETASSCGPLFSFYWPTTNSPGTYSLMLSSSLAGGLKDRALEVQAKEKMSRL